MKAAILTSAVFAAVLFVAAFSFNARDTGHTCQLPCTIHTGLQEDEVRYDYQHGGAARVYRVTP